MKEATKEMLMGVSTATLCTALFKKGLRNQFVQEVKPVAPKGANMVGPAFTLRYIPAREDLNEISVFEDPEHPQRAAIEQCPEGAVHVIDCRKDARAASAGSILVSRLMVRGCAGIVTDGGFRDSPEIGALDIPAYHSHPSAPTNLTRHQDIADEIAQEAVNMTAFEDFVTERVLDGQSIIGLYPPTDPANRAAFEAWKRENNR